MVTTTLLFGAFVLKTRCYPCMLSVCMHVTQLYTLDGTHSNWFTHLGHHVSETQLRTHTHSFQYELQVVVQNIKAVTRGATKAIQTIKELEQLCNNIRVDRTSRNDTAQNVKLETQYALVIAH